MKKLSSYIIPFVLILSLGAGCGSEEFKENENGLRYRFVKENKKNKLGNVEDIYSLNLFAKTQSGDTVLYDFLMFERYHPTYPGDFHEALGMMHEGDSAIFLLNIDSFYHYHPGIRDRRSQKSDDSLMLMHVGIESILSPLDHFVDMSEKEMVRMNEFVERKNWKIKTDTTGILYEVTSEKPNNKEIQLGDTVEIAYLYYTLDEKIIAKSKADDYWKMVVGDPEIRVPGLSRILTFMREGEELRAVIPFAEAFGADGFPPMVPPYTAIIMELEVKGVN